MTEPDDSLTISELPSVFSFLFGSDPFEEIYWPPQEMMLFGGDMRVTVPRNPYARGWRLMVDTSTNLLSGWTTVATSDDGAPATGPGVFDEGAGDPPVMVIGPAASDTNAPSLHFRARALPLP